MTTTVICGALLLCVLAAHGVDGRRPIHVDGGNEDGDMVVQACRNASDGFLSMKYCESTLRSDKRSAVAKVPRDVALIAIDVVERGAAVMDAKVEKLQSSGGGGDKADDMAFILQSCRLYDSVVASMAHLCRALVQEYKADAGRWPNIDYYSDCVDKLSSAASTCWDDYINPLPSDNAVRKALEKEGTDLSNRGNLAHAMLQVMLLHDSTNGVVSIDQSY